MLRILSVLTLCAVIPLGLGSNDRAVSQLVAMSASAPPKAPQAASSAGTPGIVHCRVLHARGRWNEWADDSFYKLLASRFGGGARCRVNVDTKDQTTEVVDFSKGAVLTLSNHHAEYDGPQSEEAVLPADGRTMTLDEVIKALDAYPGTPCGVNWSKVPGFSATATGKFSGTCANNITIVHLRLDRGRIRSFGEVTAS